MEPSGVIYVYQAKTELPKDCPSERTVLKHKNSHLVRTVGLGLIFFSLGGILGPLIPAIRLESHYYFIQAKSIIYAANDPMVALPPSAPVVFNPLKTADGKAITPVNNDFSLIIPKIGVNAPVIPAVNPANLSDYTEALKKGVAHASTSYFPNEDGTVYLFSHSTNYDWFVNDLNAVFYLLKDLDTGDTIVIVYKNTQYVYKLTDKQIVKPDEISYLVPQRGKKRLILQTCWPPGSTSERLLLFADLIQ